MLTVKPAFIEANPKNPRISLPWLSRPTLKPGSPVDLLRYRHITPVGKSGEFYNALNFTAIKVFR
jgi:hypothetical protein